jgi:hypothetical protein
LKGVLKMKGQQFFYLGLGVLLLALLGACGQVPIAEPQTGQPAPAEVMAWPPRPAQFHIVENVGVSPDENALAEYHQSERDFTSIVTSRIEENALAVYHQSEWGRTPRPILPIVENKAIADQDIGLMEFFTILNRTGLQRHDREYGLAAFSTVPTEVKQADALRAINEAGLARYHESEWGFAPHQTDADRDLGLMEFFAAPYETSRQHGRADKLEALSAIDPADRKFFNSGYGARLVMPREAEALPNIDPADRKFFAPGYGVQTISANGSEAVLPPIENKVGEWSATWFLLK